MLLPDLRLFAVLLVLTPLSLPSMAQTGSNQHRYIVVLKQDAGPPEWVAEAVALKQGGQVGYIYQHALRGFSIQIPEEAVRRVAQRPDVDYMEPDLPMSMNAQSIPTGLKRSFALGNALLAIDGQDDWRVDADVAVLDTGIDLQHPDLNVAGGANCLQSEGGGPPWARSYFCDDAASADDDHYHGTHVAGTIGALDNDIGVAGVAPGVRLWAVKVLDANGSGYTSGILAGIDWVVSQGSIEVLNMSLGGEGVSAAYETAINTAVANGVVVVVAAGNSNLDANGYSPAYVPSAITVSALADFDGLAGAQGSPTCRSDQDDTLADFSNWGTAVDIAAPGTCILSTYPIEQGGYGTISGTSMAAPHVAGAAAILASTQAPQNAADVQAITDRLTGTGNYQWLDDSGDGVHEPLLSLADDTIFAPVLMQGSVGESPNVPPVARFNYTCVGLECDFNASTSSDSDGNILAYAWDFGDDQSGSGMQASHLFATAGSYTVRLQVTDNGGLMADKTASITLTDPVAADLTLMAQGYKEKGWQKVDLVWQGLVSEQVEIYRDDVGVAVTDNTGIYTDAVGQRGGGSYTYRVCEAGTSNCTPDVVVIF